MKRFLCGIFTVCLLISGCASSGHDQTTANTEIAPGSSEATTQVTTPSQILLEVMREGEISQIPGVMVEASIGSFRVATVPEYFVHHGEEGLDAFVYESWEGSQAVFYSIGIYVEGEASFEDQMLQNYGDLYAEHSFSETEIAGYPAKEAVFSGLKADPAYCRHSYLLTCDGIAYEIQMQFTMEMYEGLYPIIRACLDTFTQL